MVDFIPERRTEREGASMVAEAEERYEKLRGLKRARRLSALTTRELGDQAGMDQSMVSKLENLRHGAHPRTIRKLAEVLDTTPSELIGDPKA